MYNYVFVQTRRKQVLVQVTKHLKNAAKYTNLWVVPVVGGMAPQKQIRLLKKGPDVVVATPGRLWDMMNVEGEMLARNKLFAFSIKFLSFSTLSTSCLV